MQIRRRRQRPIWRGPGRGRQPTLHWVNDVLATLRFRALKPGVHRIELGDVTILTDDEGTELVRRRPAESGRHPVITMGEMSMVAARFRGIVMALLLGRSPRPSASVGWAQTVRDVPPNHWAYEAVMELVNRGYIAIDDGLFAGDQPVDRFTLATVVAGCCMRWSGEASTPKRARRPTDP